MPGQRSYDLNGEVAFITGAGGGMGIGLARALSSWGARVAVVDIDETRAKETLKAVEADGGEGRAYRLDVTDEDDAERVVAACIADFGGIDLLVNAAGALTVANVTEMTLAEWRHVMDVNITGVFVASRAVARAMVARGTPASIISISSSAGRKGYPGLTHYCASKFGVIGFTQSLAIELADKEIYVNAVCPDSVDTQMLEALAEGYGITTQDLVNDQLIKRFLTGEDMAYTIAFLHTSRAITGQTVNTDGGSVFS